MNLYDIEIDVHKRIKKNGPYRVKVMILNDDIRMFINGNLVSPPNNKFPEWSVRTPTIPKNVRIVEFDGDSPLWEEYKQACIEGVQEYIRHEELNAQAAIEKVASLDDDEFNKQIAKDLEEQGL